MPTADLQDVSLWYEDIGSGTPIIWCHEYFGDYRSWAPQLNAFTRRYRNIVYSARGYPGSSCPSDQEKYSQQHMVDDLDQLLDYLAIERAVIAGLSMGAGVTINYGIQHPYRCQGLIIAGCGSGSADRQAFESKADGMLTVIASEGMTGLHRWMESDPTRIQLKDKDPLGWAEFGERLSEHTAEAAIKVYQGVQLKRPSILSLGAKLNELDVPCLVMFGDEDTGCLEPGLFMWQELPRAQLAVFAASGHCINLEEPNLFNEIVRNFVDNLVPHGPSGDPT